ncbi:CoA activase [Candidatus Aerophobetes bacterium]|uniref:CoA activase n=1 Tax=Aerophobetes bacterium TaxID=2030807 RepID=A0A662DGV5_UNCAE|nr:MAG: CoA activase [Candidatus Aerophobetes bacterium]
MDRYIAGLDLGSISVNMVIINQEGKIIYEQEYTRHNGQPLEKAREILKKIYPTYPFNSVAITGSNGELLSKEWEVPYFEEVIAQAKGTHHIDPSIRTIIDIGGMDAKFISLNNQGEVIDFGMNSSCASGTGSFLDQQAKRLELDIEEEFAKEALKSTNPARLAGRCAVFAKSDMIHLQQKATPMRDITMGLCEALVRSYRSNIARGKNFKGPISFQGGVAANKAMLVAFRKVLQREDIIILPHFFSLGALGAALLLREKREVNNFNPDKLKTSIRIKEEKGALPKLSFDFEDKKLSREQENYVFLKDEEPVDAYLGVDVGSVSTNVAIIDSNNQLIAKSYLPTAGKPIKAVQDGLREVKEKVGEKVKIRGVGVTGSGRYMIGAFIGADVIKNEITAQAKGALNIDPEVDTIFEIGGQDSKYISLDRGVIVDFTMNKACAAGTGSFLEEQADELKINIKKEFENIAFTAENPADLGDRCTVFMESALFEHLQRGVPIPDLVAGLAYSVAYNYLNKVVENRKIGDKIFFQGGTACNRSVVAAFEKILGKKVTVPPHNEVLGAIGAAILAKEEVKGQTRFKGFGLTEVKYRIDSFECQDCPNHCKVNRVLIEGEEKPLTYGDRCDKYSGKEGEKKERKMPNFFKERERLLFARYSSQRKDRKIGIPRALHTFELSPLWESFFTELGFEVVLSSRTNDRIIHRGIELAGAEVCFPVKVAHGHVMDLLEKGVDYLFLPSIIDFPQTDPRLSKTYNCPWSQGLPYFINSTLPLEKYSVCILQPKISMREGIDKALKEVGKALLNDTAKINKAIKVARKVQSKFYQALREKGESVIKGLGNKRAFVIISRPYNGCDPGLNMDIADKMAKLGMLAIPMDFLNLDPSIIAEDYPHMYWNYGQRILAAARYIKKTTNLYPIYITNFGCGPDSFVAKFFEEEMDRPFLELQIDEHSAEAGIITRLEAFLDSIQGRPFQKKKVIYSAGLPSSRNERVIYIPYMDDHSYALEAAFEALGQKAEVMPVSDDESVREGQKYTTGRECYPSILTSGDMLKIIKRKDFDPEKVAFFMGTAQGPCRFGQYKKFQEQLLKRLGYPNIPIISLSSENSYFGYGVRFTKLAWNGIVAIDILRKVQRIIRPDEKNKGETNRVYEEYRDKIREAIREDKPLLPIMRKAAQRFKQIQRIDNDKPVVTVVGEIYVRHNPYSNLFIIDELEKLGLKVELASMREWFLYTNEMHKESSLKEGKFLEFLKNRIRNFYQEFIDRRLEEPFKELIEGFEEPEIEHILELGERYLHRSLRGEAILSVGKTLSSIERGRDGVVNVMPFTCMPGNLTAAITIQIERDFPEFPILSLSYDGSRQANYLNKIRTFVAQVEAYHQKKGKGKIYFSYR